MEKFRSSIRYKLQKISRGYSDEDLSRAQRISAGYITPIDREEYKLESQRRILGGDDPRVLQLPVTTRVEITPEIRSELKRISNLPDSEIDVQLTERASNDLSKWLQEP